MCSGKGKGEGEGKGRGRGGTGNGAVSGGGKIFQARRWGRAQKGKKFFKLGLGFVREWERGGYV